MSDARPCHRSALGVTLTEYTLCAAVLLVLVIPILLGLGGVLKSRFAAMIPSTRKASLQVASVPVPATPNQPAKMESAPDGRTMTVTLTTSGGGSIQLPNFPNDISATVQTIGANGTTQLLSDQLETLSRQLLASGDITQEQSNALLTLANRGHVLGDLEKSVEAALKTGKSAKALSDYSLTSVSRKYKSADDLVGTEYSRTFKNVYQVASLMDVEKSTDQASSNLLHFQQAWDAAKQSGAMGDPKVSTLVNYLAGNIFNIANDLAGATKGLGQNKLPQSSDVLKQVASQQTHQSSAQICTVGNGSDTGLHCNPG